MLVVIFKTIIFMAIGYLVAYYVGNIVGRFTGYLAEPTLSKRLHSLYSKVKGISFRSVE